MKKEGYKVEKTVMKCASHEVHPLHTEITDEFKTSTQWQPSQTFQQTLPGRRQMEEKEANKDTLKTIRSEGNVNQSHTELLL